MSVVGHPGGPTAARVTVATDVAMQVDAGGRSLTTARTPVELLKILGERIKAKDLNGIID